MVIFLKMIVHYMKIDDSVTTAVQQKLLEYLPYSSRSFGVLQLTCVVKRMQFAYLCDAVAVLLDQSEHYLRISHKKKNR